MDHMQSRESDFEIDLESGGTTSDEDYVSNNRDLASETSICGVQSCNGSGRNQDGSNTKNKMLNADELSVRCTEIWSNKVREEMEKLGDNKMDIKKTRKPKPPKPPRPPKGPSLDASDVKLVKEISELAIWKRRRTERITALKKIKKESGSSSKMNILATVITILFFLVIIFQGLRFPLPLVESYNVFWALMYDISVYVAFEFSGRFTYNFFIDFSVRRVYDVASETVLILPVFLLSKAQFTLDTPVRSQSARFRFRGASIPFTSKIIC